MMRTTLSHCGAQTATLSKFIRLSPVSTPMVSLSGGLTAVRFSGTESFLEG